MRWQVHDRPLTLRVERGVAATGVGVETADAAMLLCWDLCVGEKTQPEQNSVGVLCVQEYKYRKAIKLC